MVVAPLLAQKGARRLDPQGIPTTHYSRPPQLTPLSKDSAPETLAWAGVIS